MVAQQKTKNKTYLAARVFSPSVQPFETTTKAVVERFAKPLKTKQGRNNV
jgi:hypothetical protein